jgi:hypothetical protein
MIRRAKDRYQNNMTEKICNGDTGSRYWWKFKQGYSEIPPLKSPTNPDTYLTDIKDKANALNTYFTGISTLPDIDRDLQKCSKSVYYYDR